MWSDGPAEQYAATPMTRGILLETKHTPASYNAEPKSVGEALLRYCDKPNWKPRHPDGHHQSEAHNQWL